MRKKDDKKQKGSVATKETQDIKKRIEELESQVKRVLADYQNLEKRNKEERVGWIQTANKELILRLLPVLDTLILALKHSEDQSLKVATQQFLDILKGEGVERIGSEGQAFDPVRMECIEVVKGEENNVVEEVRSGYILGDIILRPAQVKVGKANN